MIDTRTERVAIAARDRLVDAGLVTYVKGKKRCPNTYSLTDYTLQKVSEYDSETKYTDGNTDFLRCHIKTKKVPPKSPIRNEQAFDSFWTSYPKKQAKANARKAFDKLNPDEALLQRMLVALEWQKTSPSWTKDNGQFIPYPATWLNGRRWEDEQPESNAREPPRQRLKWEIDEKGEKMAVYAE